MKTNIAKRIAAAALGIAIAACLAPAPALAERPKPYPLQVCLVSGNELGSMGKPITKVYDGQEIIFCCKPCVKKFEANQAKYLRKLK